MPISPALTPQARPTIGLTKQVAIHRTQVAPQSSAAPQRHGIQSAARTLPPLDQYYAPAQAKEGVELLRSLKGIISSGHRDLGYKQARDAMFTTVDSINGEVTDIYAGRVVQGVNGRKSAYEKQLNAEHTWPQSHGATGAAKSDLHQIMASDISANEKRGSFPFGEVKEPMWQSPKDALGGVSILGRDAAGDIVYSPRPAIRGNIARAQLYFYTRYNGDNTSGYTLKNFRKSLPTLLKWTKEDPVDAAERSRNDRVASVQGNRNPFVDFPEWVDKVGFDKVLESGRSTSTR